MSTETPRGATPARTRAWDAPTRIFKWSLVILIAMAFWSRYYGPSYGDVTLVWHQRIGLLILILLAFRILWGFAGGSTSRFASFVRSPLAALRYGFDVLRGRRRHYLGHNPLGGWVILAMATLILVQGGTGLFTNDDILAEGPLAGVASGALVRQASIIHQNAFWLLLAIIPIHIAVNVFYTLVLRDNLIGAMFSGWKPRIAYEDMPTSRDGSWLRALVCLAIAAALVLGGIAAFGGNPFPR